MVLSLLWTALLLPSWSLAIILGSIAIPIVIFLFTDYADFIALGPGGTPQTVAGYMRVKALAMAALHDVYNAETLSSVKSGCLQSLPDRGPRPTIRGIAPHRQITQRASKEMYARLSAEIAQLSRERDDLELGVSWFEKHNTALFTNRPARLTPHGEICHAHPLDGSMHLTLHPADVKIVLEARWGERHPLARGGSFEMFVPETFVMIYAPRTEQDIEAVMRIVRASVAYVGGDELES
ncbi:hypothetical protein AMS68_007704 [Peltaster fructicola]|uniref:Luciferase domain-containing protein n=1 Tax=Peltaster fructicola TaxID=286661 RepID=A0A6H0Y566_9PEZI|nr:hypothetical protein AMS68_007704 [Peltaster fructicola]